MLFHDYSLGKTITRELKKIFFECIIKIIQETNCIKITDADIIKFMTTKMCINVDSIKPNCLN